MPKKFVVWFKDVDKEDGASVGGKGANLGEMIRVGFPVPDGFVVTVTAYRHFLTVNSLTEQIQDILYGLDVNDAKALDHVSNRIFHLMTRSPFPKEIALPVLEAYFALETRFLKNARVAVRSSATAEDLPGASFAGQQATFLNVQGEANLIEKIKEAWASLFTPRAIFYRANQKLDHMRVGIAVPVQKMVESDTSGIMFTIDPVTNNKGKITIEAIYGLGELIVQGAVTPDHYEVDKKSLTITDIRIGNQERMLLRKGEKNVEQKLSAVLSGKQKISTKIILHLAQLGKKLEQHYYFPQDVEWAIEKGKVYIVQTRPVTTTGKQSSDVSRQTSDSLKTEDRKLKTLLKGDAASPGMASGPVKKLGSAKELHKIASGDVLVASQTNPDYVPAMKKAVAIVTERGGRTSHAAIVSRELGIPAVVGAKNALSVLKDGEVVTVNGTTGEVYKGAVAPNAKFQMSNVKSITQNRMKTATKVYCNLAEPSRAEAISRMNVDGVGLLRAEFMIADIGVHPKKLLADGKQKQFINRLAEKLEVFCRAFADRPVVYRATDFKTNEYRNLTGGKAFEPEEPNPMLGFRGAARYTSDPRVFAMELEAIKVVRNKMGLKNLWLMIPFVRTPKEMMDVKKLVTANGLARSASFKLWMMCEIPSNVIRIENFLEVGIDGVSIGSNDLTMLMLGTDRDNSEVAHDFSELDPTLLWAFEHVIKSCVKRNVTVSMCGQAPSDYPDLVEKLVRWGITSVSVNPDAIDRVRETVANAEKRLVKNC